MTDPYKLDEPTLSGHSAQELERIVAALYRVHRLLAAITDLDSLLVRITEESRMVAHAEASSLILYDADQDDLYFRVAIGETGDQDALKREVRLKLGQGIAGVTAKTRTSILVADAQNDPRFFSGADAAIKFRTTSLLAVPMVDRTSLVGVLEVVNKLEGGAFTDLDRRTLEMFSALAATAVTNARLIEQHVRNERLAAIGQAVTALSHHTKNIVTGLTSSADLIDLGLSQDNPQLLTRAWPVFKRSTKRLSNFVQDMLSFSKPRQPLRRRCMPDELLREAHECFTELFAQRNIEVHVEAQGQLAPVWVDPEAIYRCLINLLTNAADAVPEQGGRIVLSARTLPGGALQLRVTDNGPGIPEDVRQRIFEPFFSTKGSHGTGIGLAVTKKNIEEHGGTIAVGSGPMGGACFLIVLPAAVPDSEEDGLA